MMRSPGGEATGLKSDRLDAKPASAKGDRAVRRQDPKSGRQRDHHHRRETSDEDHLSDVTHDESSKESGKLRDFDETKDHKKHSAGKIDLFKDSQKMVRAVGHKKEKERDRSAMSGDGIEDDLDEKGISKRSTGIKKFVQKATEKVTKNATKEEDTEFSDDDDGDLEDSSSGLEKKLRKGYTRPPTPEVLGLPELDCSLVHMPHDMEHPMELLLLAHNGIRGELFELMSAISALKDKGDSATDRQFNGFFKWWSDFAELLHAHIELEDEVVLPFLRRQPAGQGQLAVPSSGNEHTSLFLQLNTISAFKRQLGRNKSKKLGETLFAYLKDFVKHAVAHCKDSETVLIPLLSELRASASAVLGDEMMTRLRATRYMETLALSLRSLPKSYRKDFIARTLKKQDIIKYRLVRLNLEHKRAVTLELAYKDAREDKDAIGQERVTSDET